MPTSADLLLDTSVAVALVLAASADHDRAMERTRGLQLGLAGHASIETYSVLTRLPGASRLSARAAATALKANFPRSHSLGAGTAESAVSRCAQAGIAGGSVYDGLVGLAALEAGVRLLSADRRAIPTYALLGVDVELLE